MDAITLIREQHREVDELFEKLGKAKGDAQKRALFAKIADSLAAHMTMEEQVFYPHIKARSIEHVLLESTEEHLSIRRVLNDLLDTPPSDPRFAAQISVCKEQVAHHAHEEEEKELLPAVRKMYSAEELAALGGEMLATYEQQMSKSPRRHLPEEVDHAAAV